VSVNQAYPLHWPPGWPRTALPQQSKFSDRPLGQSIANLKRELELMHATGVIISSNVTLGQTPKDKGICVYFQFKGKPYALPCDKWNSVEDNLRALTNHIEALRGQERWGVGTLERAFAGYLALPAATRQWHEHAETPIKSRLNFPMLPSLHSLSLGRTSGLLPSLRSWVTQAPR
jgi:hypothetical protein